MENLPNRLSHHGHLLLCCPSSLPFFHGFSSLSRLGIVPNNWSNARCTKSSFQQVFICPKRIPIEGVMPLFFSSLQSAPSWFQHVHLWCLRHSSSRGSSIVSIMGALNRGLDGDPEYSTFLHCKSWTCAQNWWGLATSVLETWRWWCSKFWAQFPFSSFEFHVLHG